MPLAIANLASPKAEAKHELLFNKLASEASPNEAPLSD